MDRARVRLPDRAAARVLALAVLAGCAGGERSAPLPSEPERAQEAPATLEEDPQPRVTRPGLSPWPYAASAAEAAAAARRDGKTLLIFFCEGKDDFVVGPIPGGGFGKRWDTARLWSDPRVMEFVRDRFEVVRYRVLASAEHAAAARRAKVTRLPTLAFIDEDGEFDRHVGSRGYQSPEAFLTVLRGVLAARRQEQGRRERVQADRADFSERLTGPQGYYDLDAFVDFDVLDGATYDPTTRRLTLRGHRASRERFQRIDYLDCLAAAVEAGPDPLVNIAFDEDSYWVLRKFMTAGAGRLATWWLTAFSPRAYSRGTVERLGLVGEEAAPPGARRLSPADMAVWLISPEEVDAHPLTHMGWKFRERVLRELGFPIANRALPYLGFQFNSALPDSPLVFEVKPCGPAAAAGLRAGDVIEAVDGVAVGGDVVGLLGRAKRRATQAAAPIRFRVRRGDEVVEVAVKPVLTAPMKAWSTEDLAREVLRQAGDSAGVELLEAVLREPTIRPHPRGEDVRARLERAFGAVIAKRPYHVSQPLLGPALIGGHLDPLVEIRDLPQERSLTHLAYQADLALKGLLHAPILRTLVPDFVGYWDAPEVRALARKGSLAARIWLEPGEFQLDRSSDGRTIEFRSAPMRIRLALFRDVEQLLRTARGEPAQSFSHPALDAVGEQLTANYDLLTRYHPIFHKIREAMKVVAIARWLKQEGFHVELPERGRGVYPLPKYPKFFSRIFLYYRPGEIHFLEGGVSLDPEATYQEAISLDSRPVLFPAEAADQQVRRLMRGMPTVPELPKPDGWIAKAKVGERFQREVSALATEAPSAENPARAQELVSALTTKARVVQTLDKVNNAMTKDRVKAMRELELLSANARRESRAMAEEALGTLTAGIASLDGVERLLRGTSGLSEARELRERVLDVSGKLRDLRLAYDAVLRGERREEAVERLREEVEASLKDVGEELGRRGTQASPALRKLLSRSTAWAGSVHSLVSLEHQTLGMIEMNMIGTQLESGLEDQARYQARFKGTYKKAVDDYFSTREELTHELQRGRSSDGPGGEGR